jgi:hypothetical protein
VLSEDLGLDKKRKHVKELVFLSASAHNGRGGLCSRG